MSAKKSYIGIRGVEKVSKNLNAQIYKKRIGSMSGLLEAAAFIRKDMEVTPPLIPLDTGNLRASWFVTPGRTASGHPFVKMGFSAIYAILVHEMVGRIKWSRPGSGKKFLESALKRNKETLLRIIANAIK